MAIWRFARLIIAFCGLFFSLTFCFFSIFYAFYNFFPLSLYVSFSQSRRQSAHILHAQKPCEMRCTNEIAPTTAGIVQYHLYVFLFTTMQSLQLLVQHAERKAHINCENKIISLLICGIYNFAHMYTLIFSISCGSMPFHFHFIEPT